MRFSETALDQLRCSDGVNRTIHIWQAPQPRAVILAIHGGLAHAGDFVTPALYFLQQGVATVSFDMHGHDGKKRVDVPGFQTFLDDAVLFLAWVKARYPGLPIFVMGHSMGALIATHLELGVFAHEPQIKGVILSSPYFVNAVKVPKILMALSGVLAALVPKAKVPMDDISTHLTHDTRIAERHAQDEKDQLRASEASFRFASGLLKAQAKLAGGLAAWKHPLFAVVAGNDKLANAQASLALLSTVPAPLRTLEHYPDNYHENFNELNREAIFANIWRWMQALLAH